MPKRAASEPGAGHYGISRQSWRLNIRPLVLNFIDAHSGTQKVAKLATVKTAQQ